MALVCTYLSWCFGFFFSLNLFLTNSHLSPARGDKQVCIIICYPFMSSCDSSSWYLPKTSLPRQRWSIDTWLPSYGLMGITVALLTVVYNRSTDIWPLPTCCPGFNFHTSPPGYTSQPQVHKMQTEMFVNYVHTMYSLLLMIYITITVQLWQ